MCQARLLTLENAYFCGGTLECMLPAGGSDMSLSNPSSGPCKTKRHVHPWCTVCEEGLLSLSMCGSRKERSMGVGDTSLRTTADSLMAKLEPLCPFTPMLGVSSGPGPDSDAATQAPVRERRGRERETRAQVRRIVNRW
jgi:hypothetical protein